MSDDRPCIVCGATIERMANEVDLALEERARAMGEDLYKDPVAVSQARRNSMLLQSVGAPGRDVVLSTTHTPTNAIRIESNDLEDAAKLLVAELAKRRKGSWSL